MKRRVLNSITDNKRIRSSALGYAISFLLLIGLITSGVLFISATHKQIEMSYALEDHILIDNYFSLKVGAESLPIDQRQIIHTAGDTSQISVRRWGGFKAITSKTYHKQQSLSRSALVGQIANQQLPALYVPDQKQVIKLCGDTKIEGDAYLSDRGLDRGYIAKAFYKNDKLLYGTQKKSERNLPGIKMEATEIGFSSFIESSKRIDPFFNDSSFEFTEMTSLVSVIEPLLINNSISGNIVLHSFDSIFVATNAQLENVILISPVIRFETGFKGSVQAIASRRIICEEHVSLLYPSTLTLIEEEQGISNNSIELLEGSRVLGGALLVSKHPDFRKPVQLIVDQAVIGGLVYNQGETELRGKVIGHLYTSRFALNAGGGSYTNYLLDATISSKQLPEEFVLPDWLDLEDQKSVILSCF